MTEDNQTLVNLLRQVSLLKQDCQRKLTILNTALSAELEKPLDKQRGRYRLFLDKERSVYNFGISLLESLEKCDGTPNLSEEIMG